jgi:HEAT repeat protein
MQAKQEQEQLPFPSVLKAIFTNEQVPIHLLYRLSDLTSQEFKQFTDGWATADEERRRVIVHHLADIAEENYLVDFSPLFAYLFDDMDTAVRLSALEGVWDSTDSQLIAPIMELMGNDPDMSVRAAAARALAHYVLMSEWGEIGPEYSERIVEALLAEHDRADRTSDLKRATLEAMAPSNHPRVTSCISKAYESRLSDLQISALFAMGNSADERWLPILFNEMRSSVTEMRSEAARAAGPIGSSDAVPRLIELLADEDLDVCLSAVVALGQIGGDQAYEVLNQLAEDPAYEDLHDAIDQVLEEMDWLGGEFDMLNFSEQDAFDEELSSDDDDLDGFGGFRRTSPRA